MRLSGIPPERYGRNWSEGKRCLPSPLRTLGYSEADIAEIEAYAEDYDMDMRVARYHNIYGPNGTYRGGREKSPAAICRKVAEALDPGTITIWGDGKQTRSYCYVDDAVRGTVMLMESDFSKPLNIGSDRMISVDQLTDIIIRVSGKRIKKEHDLAAPQGVRGRNADISLAKEVLGWQPRLSLEEGLAKTYNWIASRCEEDRQEALLLSSIR